MGKRIAAAGAVVLAGVTAALAVLLVLHAGLGRLAGFDHGVQGWVHGWASPGLTGVMMALAKLGATASFVPAVAFVVVGMALRKDGRRAGLLGMAVIGALALNEGLKAYFQRARPVVAWAMEHEKTYSYPSGHALFAATLYGTLAWLAWRGATAGRRCGLVAVAGALVVGIGVSRVYLGVHWPTDVLAGYAVGAIWVGTMMVAERMWGG